MITTDFNCSKCGEEVAVIPLTSLIKCNNCRENLIIGTPEVWEKEIKPWFSDNFLIYQNFIISSLIIDKENQNHMAIKSLELDDKILKNSDELNGKTEPANDFIDQNNEKYEMISLKPTIYFNQIPFLQKKIIEKVNKYDRMKIDLSKITLIILDISNPFGNQSQPIIFNQSDFAYKYMRRFKQHYFITPWYVKDLGDKIEPESWIMTKYSASWPPINENKWAYPFKIKDFFKLGYKIRKINGEMRPVPTYIPK